MPGIRQQRATEFLQSLPDGATTQAVAKHLALDRGTVWTLLSRTPLVYIDRWVKSKGEGRGSNMYTAIWCAVTVPEHCPRPDGKRVANHKPRLRKENP